MKTIIFIVILVLALSPSVISQQKDSTNEPLWNYTIEDEDSSIFQFFSNIVTPQSVMDIKAIRAYIRDPRFLALSEKYGALRAIDAIYLRSLQIAENNIQRALFISFMSVLTQRNIKILIPLTNGIKLPISLEPDTSFRKRANNLPRRMYPDSPTDEFGDRDKIQHFFGSAYLSYVSGSTSVTRGMGDIIEWGEAKIIFGGIDDLRDKRANKNGSLFGNALLSQPNLLPSEYLGKLK